MKILSLIVPCYNSQDYMEKCIESLLPGGENVEILLINDGSNDATGDIADSYQSKYPHMVRVFHQSNKGHGGAINTGIHHAIGRYIKVVDSDDWFDLTAYKTVLEKLENINEQNQHIDMFICNYVYEKVGAKKKKIINYTGALPENRVFTWEETGKFKKGQYMLMHSVIYSRDLIMKSHLQLPEHTFYVDNLFVFIPLVHVEKMFYLNVDLYRYFIGRENQSVNEAMMIKRVDQQLLVNRLMLNKVSLEEIDNKKKRHYMFNYFEIVTIVSSVILVREGSATSLSKKEELWTDISMESLWVRNRLLMHIAGLLSYSNSYFSRNVLSILYKLSNKVFGFN